MMNARPADERVAITSGQPRGRFVVARPNALLRGRAGRSIRAFLFARLIRPPYSPALFEGQSEVADLVADRCSEA